MDHDPPAKTKWTPLGILMLATGALALIFTGSRDGVMRAYSTAEGKILWEFNTATEFPKTVNGVPGKGGALGGPGGVSVADGMVFVTSGYAILGGAPGNVVLAFGPQ